MAEASLNRAMSMPRRGGSGIVTSVAVVVLPLLALWGAFALWYQIPGGNTTKAVSVAIWVLFALATVLAVFKGRTLIAVSCFALAFAGLLIWWQQILPSNQREWADDVSRTTSGQVN